LLNRRFRGLDEFGEFEEFAGIKKRDKEIKVEMAEETFPHKAKRFRSRLGMRNRARAMSIITETISSSDERSDRELEQERRLIGALPHGAASMPPSNRRPTQNNAISSSSTAGKSTQYFKYEMNRWCNYDTNDPSWDTIINPNYAHKNTIDPIISTTDFDSSAGIDSTKLASLATPIIDIQSDHEDNNLKESLRKIEKMIYDAGETGTGFDDDNSDIVEIPVLDEAPVNNPTTGLEGAVAAPAPAPAPITEPHQAKAKESEIITLSSEASDASNNNVVNTN
jgi:hypothetical protein